MSRLTRRGMHNGLAGFWVKENDGSESFISWQDDGYDGIAKIAHYEDLEEQGMLIVAKYAKGQTVYSVDDETYEIQDYKVENHEVWSKVTTDHRDSWNYLDSFREDCPLVFATKEEAEAKVVELKGVHNE